MTLTIPFNFTPRPYQIPALRALDSGANRLVLVHHRRAGKDKLCLNITIKKMVERRGVYFYMFPTFAQAKKVIWNGIDRDGFPFLSHFPDKLIKRKNETELKIELVNGSIFQLIGTDAVDHIMGTNPIGCVFSEFALQDPSAWDYVRPILRENGGWAIFNFTPRGKNHGHDIFEIAERQRAAGDPTWFVECLTIEDTDVLSEADMATERRDGMTEELIQQEFYCSFSGVMAGAYFAKEMQRARDGARVTHVPYQKQLKVDTWWDLGVADATAIWFTQDVGREVHVIDYLEDSGEGLPHYARALQDKGYVYGTHHAPHDIAVRELGSGKSRLETADSLGIRFVTVPNIDRMDGIDAARSFIDLCWFDATNTARGRDALMSYHKTWDDKRKCFSQRPYHDWSSNGADAWRYLAVGHKFGAPERKKITVKSGNPNDPHGWLGT